MTSNAVLLSWWVLAGAAGFAVAGLVEAAVGPSNGLLVVFYITVGGTAAGLLQWLALRRYVSGAGLWVAACAGGGLAAGPGWSCRRRARGFGCGCGPRFACRPGSGRGHRRASRLRSHSARWLEFYSGWCFNVNSRDRTGGCLAVRQGGIGGGLTAGITEGVAGWALLGAVYGSITGCVLVGILVWRPASGRSTLALIVECEARFRTRRFAMGR